MRLLRLPLFNVTFRMNVWNNLVWDIYKIEEIKYFFTILQQCYSHSLFNMAFYCHKLFAWWRSSSEMFCINISLQVWQCVSVFATSLCSPQKSLVMEVTWFRSCSVWCQSGVSLVSHIATVYYISIYNFVALFHAAWSFLDRVCRITV